MTQFSKQKKKILYIITKSNWGGAQRYVYDLATYFGAQDGYEVVVALGGNGELKKKLEERNIRVVQLTALGRDVSILGDIRAFFEILKLLHKEQPDVVHLNSTKAALLGSLACFFYNLVAGGYGLVAIFTVHGWAFNEPRPLWQKLLIVLMQWKTTLLCDKTIVVSEYLKKQTRLWPFVSRKIAVIYNGVPELEFLSREESCGKLLAQGSAFSRRASRGSSRPNLVQSFPQETRIVTIAELHKNKGLDVAIEALALLKDINFSYTIIGEGEERSALETRIKKHGLEDRVFLAGYIPDAHKYLKAFDLFLLPSRTEALGYALLEAAQAGLPVVATSVGGIPEIVEHKKNGLLVPPENPRALAHALRFMIVNTDVRLSATHEIQSVTKNKFSLETMREKTKTLY